MSRSDRACNETATLKPIGFALAAVVAGLGPAKADQAVRAQAPAPAPDQATAASGMIASFAPDDVLVLDTPLDENGVDENSAAAPLAAPLAGEAAPADKTQGDLFDPDVPLGRT
jgi:hypothetical protein